MVARFTYRERQLATVQGLNTYELGTFFDHKTNLSVKFLYLFTPGHPVLDLVAPPGDLGQHLPVVHLPPYHRRISHSVCGRRARAFRDRERAQRRLLATAPARARGRSVAGLHRPVVSAVRLFDSRHELTEPR